MKTQELTKEESLEIITSMIGEAKRSIAKGGSFYFLLWGFVVAIANFGQYILDMIDYGRPYIVWSISIPAAMVTVIYSVKLGRRSGVTSHFDRIYGQIWMVLGIAMVCTLVFMSKINFNHNAIIMLLAASGTYISGSMLRFKPLIFGGLILILASCVAFTQTPENQNLVAGIAIIAGYIIPGFLLKKQEGE